MNKLAHIVMIKAELLQREQVLNVFNVSRDQIIHPDHLIALVYKLVAEMRTKEAGGASYEYAFHDLELNEMVVRSLIR